MSDCSYSIKVSLLIENLLKDSNTFKMMNADEVDMTIVHLLEKAYLTSCQIKLERDPYLNNDNKVEEKRIDVLEKILKNNLWKSLTYLFEHISSPYDEFARKSINEYLRRQLSNYKLGLSENKTLKVILKHIPSINISLAGNTIPTRILRLEISNEDKMEMLKYCMEKPFFDAFMQNEDGTYFFEKYMEDLAIKETQKEDLTILSYLYRQENIKWLLINTIDKMPAQKKEKFNCLLLNDKLKNELEKSDAQTIVKKI